ncbi:hypothetical protein FNU76_10290 [Chitinimonas arctica]|uniref:Uncharacterized protein n=1 Tax=Chitinimonas arctica TaxID=2594795 RepID=A0A516SF04_9NEIS|nr:hypothetical protein [Chitinimonas arctica]QDQ26722.1 hypothetical protein FNU76_10290 [Chitinimonas arctica]
MPTPTKIAENIKRVLALFEPEPSRQVMALAGMLKVSRTVAHRHLTRGPAKLDMLGRIANALGVSLGALWDEETVGTEVVIARIAVSGTLTDCIAWYEPHLSTPFNSQDLLGWNNNGTWQIDRFRNRREPGYPIRRLEMYCQKPLPDSTHVTVYSDMDKSFARELAVGLDRHGYTSSAPRDVRALVDACKAYPAGVLVLQSRVAEAIVQSIESQLKTVFSTLIVCDGALPDHDPLAGRFYCSSDPVPILFLLRRMASSRKPLPTSTHRSIK